jgi:hypothetical protein
MRRAPRPVRLHASPGTAAPPGTPHPGLERGAPSRSLIRSAVWHTAAAMAGIVVSSIRESGPDTLMLATTDPVRSNTGPATQPSRRPSSCVSAYGQRGVPPGAISHRHRDREGGAGAGYPSAVQNAAALPAAYRPGTGLPSARSTRPSVPGPWLLMVQELFPPPCGSGVAIARPLPHRGLLRAARFASGRGINP